MPARTINPATKEEEIYPADALVVCAGTVTIKTVSNMGSGFAVFKKLFGYNNFQEKTNDGNWAYFLQQHLTNYPKRPLPAYIHIDSAVKGRLLGGVATVPDLRSFSGLEGPCSNKETLKGQYKEAVKGAVLKAKDLGRPLYIQPLGIGVYGWPPEEAAELFAAAISEVDPGNIVDITIPIFDQTAKSNDKRFESEFNNIMKAKKQPSNVLAAVNPPIVENPIVPLNVANLVSPKINEDTLSDHELIIQNTHYGAVATYNVLSPGARYSHNQSTPKIDPERMKETARYLYGALESGVGLIALQEVPNTTSQNYNDLISELERLDKTKKILGLSAYQQTRSHHFGTMILTDKNVFEIQQTQSIQSNDGCFGIECEVKAKNDGKMLTIANIHGDGDPKKNGKNTIQYINEFINKSTKGFLLGDTNLNDNNKPVMNQKIGVISSFIKPSTGSYKGAGKLNTFDCIVDTVSRTKDATFTPDLTNITKPVLQNTKAAPAVIDSSAIANQFLEQVNAMSDHKAQVDAPLKLVSQNLQGPYAIKINSKDSPAPLYLFDLPNYKDKNDPNRLHELTGMDLPDCAAFINANTNRDEATLTNILTKYKIGDKLGQGGFRLALETDKAYNARMIKQIDLLKNMIPGGANILSIQEQPYLGIDNKRYTIFENIMNVAGYVCVAKQDKRDVGIWVKKELESKSHSVLLPDLSDSILRGCAAEIDGVLCINLHADRATNKATVDALLKLKTNAMDYANTKKPPLRISITGDTNLFQLDPEQKRRLETVGFTTEKVKGQESIKAPNLPNYEAFFKDMGPPHVFAKPAPACSNHSHKKLVDDALNDSLNNYIQSRKADPRKYFRFFASVFGGHDKETKISAAEKLAKYDINSNKKFQITKTELAALQQGRLKEIASEKLAQITDENITIVPNKRL